MRKIMILVVMVAAFALPTMAQNYEAQQPNSAFQSTSTMMGSGSSLSSNPTINENGTATTPSYSPAKASGSGPRKAGSLPGKPTNGDGDDGNTPIGDAVLPLMLLLGVYCSILVIRRNKHVKEVKS